MTIGIIGAMVEEVERYREAMRGERETRHAGIPFYRGELAGRDVVVCKSGVGKVNAAVCTQLLIDRFQVSRIVFTGVAGALHPELEIGDIVVSRDCVQHDVDATALGFQRGEIPFHPKWVFEADPQLVALAERAARRMTEVRVMTGRVLSGDQFVTDRDKARGLHEQFGGLCLEMEGAAVAQVCDMNGVPFVVIRSMSDKADGSAPVDFPAFVKLASRRSCEVVCAMLEELEATSAGRGE